MKTESNQIQTLLPLVMADIGAIGKGQENTQQRYNFRGIDDVLNHCNPVLIKHGVSVSVQVHSHEMKETPHKQGFRTTVKLLMDVIFTAPDGSSSKNTTAGEAMDYNGDKATNKAMAAAMKYAFFFGLVIPVQPGVVDDSDHDEKIPEVPAGAKPKGPTVTAAQVKRISSLIVDLSISVEKVGSGVRRFTGNRSDQIEDLTKAEAEDFILSLEDVKAKREQENDKIPGIPGK